MSACSERVVKDARFGWLWTIHRAIPTVQQSGWVARMGPAKGRSWKVLESVCRDVHGRRGVIQALANGGAGHGRSIESAIPDKALCIFFAPVEEFVETVRRDATIDWTMRENARAQLRILSKRIPRNLGYPPNSRRRRRGRGWSRLHCSRQSGGQRERDI